MTTGPRMAGGVGGGARVVLFNTLCLLAFISLWHTKEDGATFRRTFRLCDFLYY